MARLPIVDLKSMSDHVLLLYVGPRSAIGRAPDS